MSTASAEVLWTPTSARATRAHMSRFAASVALQDESTSSSSPPRYADLHRWSVDSPGDFWWRVWEYTGVLGTRGSEACVRGKKFYDWTFFPEGRLSFVENLLRPKKLADAHYADSIAVMSYDENGHRGRLTRRELWNSVCNLAVAFQSKGLGRGSRIAAVLPNGLEGVIAMLATSAIGGIWSCCAPDFGDDALFDRFGQMAPELLITTSTVQYNGKLFDLHPRLERLASRLPSVGHWIFLDKPPRPPRDSIVMSGWEEFDFQKEIPQDFPLERFPFNHPLAILYSSGTTGVPKCMVHGAGGTLLQHLKEHQLHCDLFPEDRLLYYTSTGWMMWNWLVSALASEATIVLVDGSPLRPSTGALWEIAAAEKVTHFGSSARYYAAIEQEAYRPCEHHDLAALRTVLSTGSPLLPDQFRWLYGSIKPDMHLASISGGTDIISCFVLGDPTQAVRAGEIQCKGLGMDVRIFDEQGNAITGEPGELVCATPFPSMPIGFWNDPDGGKYHATYFSRYADVWAHGDWAVETDAGGFIIYGRSDAVLNPGGVRIGTGEIYQQLKSFPQVAEGLATVLRHEGDEQIVLFVRLAVGGPLRDELIQAICNRLRQHCSPRHVPRYLVQAPDLPRTVSGKLSEIAARNAIHGAKIGNRAALANPQCLEFFEQWGLQTRASRGLGDPQEASS